MDNFSEQLAELKRGCVEIIPLDLLTKKLSRGQPLCIKLGLDPTSPDLHLGHTVVLQKLHQFQNYGHKIVIVIGDFTGMIGDPSERNVTRPSLSKEQVLANAKTYQEQIFKVLDSDKTEVRFNSEWLGKLSAHDLVHLAASQTVARMLERDDFSKRYRENKPISIHEFLYPLLQGYDSVAINADVEFGGTDQKFNLLMGRELQKQKNQEPQVIMTMPLLEGTDGVKKMSKSYGNSIGIHDSPDNMFGKIMSISDDLMWRYFELLSDRSLKGIEQLRGEAAAGENPKNIKLLLAEELVGRFHSVEEAGLAKQKFVDQFSRGKLPEDMPVYEITAELSSLPLVNVLQKLGLIQTTSEGHRLLRQGAIKLGGDKVFENTVITHEQGEVIVQVGKRRLAKLLFNSEVK